MSQVRDFGLDLLMVPIFLLVPILTIALLKYAGLSIRRFSIPSFFVIAYLISVYLGSVILYYGWDTYAISLGVTDRETIFKLSYFASTALLMVIAGSIFASRALRRAGPASLRGPTKHASAAQRGLFASLGAMCVGVLALYLSRVEDIALFAALDGDLIRAAVARSRMGSEFPGSYWRYHLFFRHLLDLSVLFFFVDFKISRRRSSGVAFGILLSIAAFTAAMAIEKGPLAKLIIMLFLAHIAARDGRYWNRDTKYVVALILGVLAFSFMTFMGAGDAAAAVEQVLTRISTGQIIPAYFYLEQFPRQMGYLWGTSFPNPGSILPFEPFPLTREISRLISPNDVIRGVVGSAPTVYWAEMYANFGPIAVWVSSFCVGVGIFVIWHIITRLPRSVPVLALLSFLAMHYRTLTGTSLTSYLVDTTLVAVVVVTGIALALGGSRRELTNFSVSVLRVQGATAPRPPTPDLPTRPEPPQSAD